MWALRPQNNNQHLNKMVHAERDQQNFVHLYMENVKFLFKPREEDRQSRSGLCAESWNLEAKERQEDLFRFSNFVNSISLDPLPLTAKCRKKHSKIESQRPL